jgi:hypothetical protein
MLLICLLTVAAYLAAHKRPDRGFAVMAIATLVWLGWKITAR